MTRLASKYSPVSRLAALALVAGTWSAGACGGSSSSDNPSDMSDAGGSGSGSDAGSGSGSDVTDGPTGNAQFIHAAPTAGRLDFYVHGRTMPTLTFSAYTTSSAQLKVPAGMVQFDVRLAGAPASTAPIYTSAPIMVEDNRSISVIAVGERATDPDHPPSADRAFRLLVLPGAAAAAAPGKARVHVVNAMYSAPALNVDLGDDGSVEIASLAELAASDATFDVTAGSDLQVAIAGLASATAAAVRIGAFTVAGSSLGDGADVYVVISGLSNFPPRDPNGAMAMAVPAAGKGSAAAARLNPVVYLLAAAPDAGGLDVYFGGAKLASALAFGAVSASELRPTTAGYMLDVRIAGADAPLASLSTGALDAGQQYLAVLTGLVNPAAASDALALRVYREATTSTNDFGHVRVIHACLGAGPIDSGRYTAATGSLQVWNDYSEFAAIPPGESSPAAGTVIQASTTPSAFALGARLTASPDVALRFGAYPALQATDRVFAVLAGAWAPTGDQMPARYVMVKTAATGAWTSTVLVPVPSSVEVSPASLDVALGDTKQLVATAQFSNQTSQAVTTSATWTSADPAMVQMSALTGGLVTGKVFGTTTVSAKFGGLTGTAEVHVVPRPAIASTLPADGLAGVDPGTPIAVSFTQKVSGATLVAQTTDGPCSGTLQLSGDGFASCIALAHASPVLDPTGQVATFQPVAPLVPQTTYRLRVLAAVTTPGGVAMASDFTQTTGFSVAVGLTVAAAQPADGAIDILAATPITVTFNRAIAPASLIVQTQSGACTGALQLSSDGFTTCVGFTQAAPAMDAANQVAALQPAAPLAAEATYQVRVLGTVTSAAGVAIGGDFTQASGFTVVSLQPPVVSATSPAAAATRVTTRGAIAVTFSVGIAPASLTAQTQSGACSGTVQLSADAFATCVGFTQAAPVMDATSRTATFQPGAPLAGLASYQLRIARAATSVAGIAMGSDFTQTPGFTTTCGGKLVVSQVFGGGNVAKWSNDFIELFNAGNEPVELSRYAVQAGVGIGTAGWNVQDLSAVAATIPPGGFFLIKESPASPTAGLPALAADYAPPSGLFTISGTDAKIAVTQGTTALPSGSCTGASWIDLIGYGRASCFETTVLPTPAPANQTAAIRKDVCVDSNNNAADFMIGDPVPRNRATPVQPCACPGN